MESFKNSLEQRITAVEMKLDALLSQKSPQTPQTTLKEIPPGYDKVLMKLEELITTSEKIDKKLLSMVQEMRPSFQSVQNMMQLAVRYKKPAAKQLEELLLEHRALLERVRKHRLDIDYVSHEKAILEGLGVVMCEYHSCCRHHSFTSSCT